MLFFYTFRIPIESSWRDEHLSCVSSSANSIGLGGTVTKKWKKTFYLWYFSNTCLHFFLVKILTGTIWPLRFLKFFYSFLLFHRFYNNLMYSIQLALCMMSLTALYACYPPSRIEINASMLLARTNIYTLSNFRFHQLWEHSLCHALFIRIYTFYRLNRWTNFEIYMRILF